jgi:hypothetical protein
MLIEFLLSRPASLRDSSPVTVIFVTVIENLPMYAFAYGPHDLLSEEENIVITAELCQDWLR